MYERIKMYCLFSSTKYFYFFKNYFRLNYQNKNLLQSCTSYNVLSSPFLLSSSRPYYYFRNIFYLSKSYNIVSSFFFRDASLILTSCSMHCRILQSYLDLSFFSSASFTSSTIRKKKRSFLISHTNNISCIQNNNKLNFLRRMNKINFDNYRKREESKGVELKKINLNNYRKRKESKDVEFQIKQRTKREKNIHGVCQKSKNEHFVERYNKIKKVTCCIPKFRANTRETQMQINKKKKLQELQKTKEELSYILFAMLEKSKSSINMKFNNASIVLFFFFQQLNFIIKHGFSSSLLLHSFASDKICAVYFSRVFLHSYSCFPLCTFKLPSSVQFSFLTTPSSFKYPFKTFAYIHGNPSIVHNEIESVRRMSEKFLKAGLFLRSITVIIVSVFTLVGFILLYNWEEVKKTLGSEGAHVITESMKSQQLQFTASEFSKQLIDDILKDPSLLDVVVKWLEDVLHHSEDELALLVNRLLKTEIVINQVMKISDCIVNHLCSSKYVQQQVSDLLVCAINFPSAREAAASWCTSLLAREDIKLAAQEFANNSIIENEDVRKTAIESASLVVSKVLSDPTTSSLTKEYIYQVLSDTSFQSFASDVLWTVFKKSVAPRWFKSSSVIGPLPLDDETNEIKSADSFSKKSSVHNKTESFTLSASVNPSASDTSLKSSKKNEKSENNDKAIGILKEIFRSIEDKDTNFIDKRKLDEAINLLQLTKEEKEDYIEEEKEDYIKEEKEDYIKEEKEDYIEEEKRNERNKGNEEARCTTLKTERNDNNASANEETPKMSVNFNNMTIHPENQEARYMNDNEFLSSNYKKYDQTKKNSKVCFSNDSKENQLIKEGVVDKTVNINEENIINNETKCIIIDNEETIANQIQNNRMNSERIKNNMRDENYHDDSHIIMLLNEKQNNLKNSKYNAMSEVDELGDESFASQGNSLRFKTTDESIASEMPKKHEAVSVLQEKIEELHNVVNKLESSLTNNSNTSSSMVSNDNENDNKEKFNMKSINDELDLISMNKNNEDHFCVFDLVKFVPPPPVVEISSPLSFIIPQVSPYACYNNQEKENRNTDTIYNTGNNKYFETKCCGHNKNDHFQFCIHSKNKGNKYDNKFHIFYDEDKSRETFLNHLKNLWFNSEKEENDDIMIQTRKIESNFNFFYDTILQSSSFSCNKGIFDKKINEHNPKIKHFFQQLKINLKYHVTKVKSYTNIFSDNIVKLNNYFDKKIKLQSWFRGDSDSINLYRSEKQENNLISINSKRIIAKTEEERSVKNIFEKQDTNFDCEDTKSQQRLEEINIGDLNGSKENKKEESKEDIKKRKQKESYELEKR